jgi:peptide-methionine (S)-S-oxide reductase
MHNQSTEKEVITLGGGCFWCIEAIFHMINGVVKVEPGYADGHVSNPTYQEVLTGNTGYAEVVQITYNPQVITFHEILEIFFSSHDPTTLNRQGADIGTQYRSLILYHTLEQKQISEHIIKKLTLEKIWNAPIVTQIKPIKTFYQAEDYHQHYYNQNPKQLYCKLVIEPTIRKIRKIYRTKLKKK